MLWTGEHVTAVGWVAAPGSSHAETVPDVFLGGVRACPRTRPPRLTRAVARTGCDFAANPAGNCATGGCEHRRARAPR